MTQPILVPLDGSPLADGAVPYAVTLAEVEGCSLELLAVAEPLGPGSSAGRLTSLVVEGLRSHLHAIAERLRGEGMLVETAVREGDPADVIMAHIGERHTQLVVMTTRGLGGVQRWLVGSVADKIVRRARCPVLLVRPPTSTTDVTAPWRPHRLLVPLDGSQLAEQTLPLAYHWAKGLGAEVLLARAEPWLATRVTIPYGYVPDLAIWEERAAQAAADYLMEIRQQAPTGMMARTMVLRGEPATCLTACAEQEHVDLIVMTSHGRGGLQRLVMGSIADRLIREGPPVCVVHPTEPGFDTTEAPTSGTVPA